MIIKELERNEIKKNVDNSNLLSFLSYEVYQLVNQKVHESSMNYYSMKDKFFKINEELKKTKNEYLTYCKNISKERILSRVIDLIESLRKEGYFKGNNKSKILKLLNSLDKKNISSLRSLEEDLLVLQQK